MGHLHTQLGLDLLFQLLQPVGGGNEGWSVGEKDSVSVCACVCVWCLCA